MKKMFVGALVALGMMTACDGGPTAKMESELDSMSYAIGMTQSRGLTEYLASSGLDIAYLDEFLKGVQDAYAAENNPKKTAYMMGLQIGQQICNGLIPGANQEIFGEDSVNSINVKAFFAGFGAGAKNDTTYMDVDGSVDYVRTHLESIKNRIADEKYGDVRKASEAFMVAKATEADVNKIADGVYYKVLNEGTGAVPTDTDRVKIKYEGRLVDGTVFDSNYEAEPTEFDLKQDMMLPGFVAALKLMPAGSEWEIYLSYEQAYGTHNMGMIPPCSALIFKVRLIEIIK